ncbi:sodium:proton antiporter [Candidatus Cardinium hertigii]|uniref:Citrate transporter n=1 Tax=Candidatus Cardinium hertigii TaxID=247481 RepID=A0A3N2QCE1_9BACT|nr:sodium:proton antiporter [Candidatus Cardinium hertigii]ROT47478.1 citrate transporter [Candidatus Cardinium hertigii]
MLDTLPAGGTMLPPYCLALPFITLLLMIATGPLLFPHFWHKHYPKVAILLASFVMAYYCIVLENKIKPVEAAAEYIQFISLITALYMATNGILIKIHARTTPLANIILLFIGALAANVIGTTGASMLFIRPYIRLNKHRIKSYHIVFFIFIVSNIGGALTPIGDPPLFLGFLKGIPFGWTLIHNFLPWLIAILMILSIFYILDKSNKDLSDPQYTNYSRKGMISIRGSKHLIWLGIIMGAVFLDVTMLPWLPTIAYHGHHISFVRELIMLIVAALAYYTSDKKVLISNEFNFEPLYEVCLIFIKNFGTMIPALELIGSFAQSEWGKQLITPTNLYWGSGVFSAILDNAPTYLNFVTASMASHGADISLVASVQAYAAGGIYPNSVMELKAISLASVCFGAMTYIGNGPNFMVKSIAEQAGIKMPSFGKYIYRFSLPFLFPILFIIWVLFFS